MNRTRPPASPTKIIAPYNFVPLANKLPYFSPDDVDRISHEVPFSDGWSGALTLELETISPLFVGDQTLRPASDRHPALKACFQIGGQPAIPGTAIKGALRNVIEIASFGKLGDRIDDKRLSIRDLQNPAAYVNHLTKDYAPLSKAGWLAIDEITGAWMLRPCEFSLALQTDLEAFAKRHLPPKRPPDLGQRQLAENKYEKWKEAGLPLDIGFTPHPVSTEGPFAKGREVSRASDIGNGKTRGTIVFTGQPQQRRPKDTKQVDFIFHSDSNTPIPITDQVRDAFETGHRDPNNGQPNREWGRWLPVLRAGGRVPIFWLPDGGGNSIRAMGFAMMFRLPYKHGIRDLAWQEGQGPDLADAIFGYVSPAESLKGRVRVADAVLVHPSDERLAPVTTPMLAPKPGYYPAYLRQPEDPMATGTVPLVDGSRYNWKTGVRAYQTYMDAAVLRGWKRYPVSRETRRPVLPEKVNNKVMTEFTPVGSGARFRCRLDVHNLRPEELGAVVWAIGFGERGGRFCHSLGGAKFLGYGCTRISITGGELEPNDPSAPGLSGEPAMEVLWARALPAFVSLMTSRVSKTWSASPQLTELLAMADPDLGDKATDDGSLGQLGAPKDFQILKGRRVGAVLQNYSDIVSPYLANNASYKFVYYEGEEVIIIEDDGLECEIMYSDEEYIGWVPKKELTFK